MPRVDYDSLSFFLQYWCFPYIIKYNFNFKVRLLSIFCVDAHIRHCFPFRRKCLISERMGFMKKQLRIRNLSYMILFFLMIFFSGYFFPKLNNSFIDCNLTFMAYVIPFILSLFLYHSVIIEAVRTLDKSSFNHLFTIGPITFLAEVLGGIVLSQLNIESLNQNALDSANQSNILFLNLTIVFFAPVVEEIVYRHCIFSFFPNNKIVASIISVAFFSFMHVSHYVIIDHNLQQLFAMIPYIPLGTGLCILYAKTGNICLPILLHMSINLISIIV